MAEMLNVEAVLDNLSLAPSMLGVEFGCGSAMFTIALAKRMHKGKVYAIDIQEEKLSALKGRLLIEKINNVSLIHADLEQPNATGLRDGMLDVVLIPNMLFQTENKHAIIEEGKRILKTGGELLIIDWLKEGPFSPREAMIKPETMKAMAAEVGLTLKKEFAAGEYHYALLFTR